MLSHSSNNRFGLFRIMKQEILALCRRLRFKLFWFSRVLFSPDDLIKGEGEEDQLTRVFSLMIRKLSDCFVAVLVSDSLAQINFFNFALRYSRCKLDVNKSSKASLVIGDDRKLSRNDPLQNYCNKNLHALATKLWGNWWLWRNLNWNLIVRD